MSTDVLRIRLADGLGAKKCNKDQWMIAPHLTNSEKNLRIVTTVKDHLDKLHRGLPFRSSISALRDDLRKLTFMESSAILDSFESLQLQQPLSHVFDSAFREVVIAAHEAEVVDKHRLLGKFAISLLQLIDSE